MNRFYGNIFVVVNSIIIEFVLKSVKVSGERDVHHVYNV